MDSDDFAGGGSSSAKIRRQVKQQCNSPLSRLLSIFADTNYVHRVLSEIGHMQGCPPPVFSNLRCGAWYVPKANEERLGESSSLSCYFKSTDGHVGTPAFPLSRLNLHVALSVARHGSVCVVDATKSGKSFPDSLTRTLPIWAAIMCHIVLGDAPGVYLSLPPWIPASEAHYLKSTVLPELAAGVGSAVRETVISSLSGHLTQPITFAWISRSNMDPPCRTCGAPPGPTHDTAAACCLSHASKATGSIHLDSAAAAHRTSCTTIDVDTTADTTVCHTSSSRVTRSTSPGPRIVCISASESLDASSLLVHCASEAGWAYVAGAGDDAENWCRGISAHITPDRVWAVLNEAQQRHSESGLGSWSPWGVLTTYLEDAGTHRLPPVRMACASAGTSTRTDGRVDAAAALPFRQMFSPPTMAPVEFLCYATHGEEPRCKDMSAAVGSLASKHSLPGASWQVSMLPMDRTHFPALASMYATHGHFKHAIGSGASLPEDTCTAGASSDESRDMADCLVKQTGSRILVRLPVDKQAWSKCRTWFDDAFFPLLTRICQDTCLTASPAGGDGDATGNERRSSLRLLFPEALAPYALLFAACYNLLQPPSPTSYPSHSELHRALQSSIGGLQLVLGCTPPPRHVQTAALAYLALQIPWGGATGSEGLADP